jgi:hypothetical protein
LPSCCEFGRIATQTTPSQILSAHLNLPFQAEIEPDGVSMSDMIVQAVPAVAGFWLDLFTLLVAIAKFFGA